MKRRGHRERTPLLTFTNNVNTLKKLPGCCEALLSFLLFLFNAAAGCLLASGRLRVAERATSENYIFVENSFSTFKAFCVRDENEHVSSDSRRIVE